MHYNFWSKLYFYMKFLVHVYFSMDYMYSEKFILAGKKILLWNILSQILRLFCHCSTQKPRTIYRLNFWTSILILF